MRTVALSARLTLLSLLPLLSLSPLVALGACSSSSSPSAATPDGSTGDPADGSATNHPDASTTSAGSCTPAPGYPGNSKHVGAYCTNNGGQCSTYSGPPVQCSIDLDPAGSNFCIQIGCAASSDCGESACCTGRAGNPIHACVPSGCFDGGACPPIPQ